MKFQLKKIWFDCESTVLVIYVGDLTNNFEFLVTINATDYK